MKKLRVLPNRKENNQVLDFFVVEELLLEHEYALDPSSVILTNDDSIDIGDIIDPSGNLIKKIDIQDPTPETGLTKEDMILSLEITKNRNANTIIEYTGYINTLQQRCDLANTSWPVEFTEKEIEAGSNLLTKEKYIERKQKNIQGLNEQISKIQLEIEDIDREIFQINISM